MQNEASCTQLEARVAKKQRKWFFPEKRKNGKKIFSRKTTNISIYKECLWRFENREDLGMIGTIIMREGADGGALGPETETNESLISSDYLSRNPSQPNYEAASERRSRDCKEMCLWAEAADEKERFERRLYGKQIVFSSMSYNEPLLIYAYNSTRDLYGFSFEGNFFCLRWQPSPDDHHAVACTNDVSHFHSTQLFKARLVAQWAGKFSLAIPFQSSFRCSGFGMAVGTGLT